LLRSPERDVQLIDKNGMGTERLFIYIDALTRSINAIPPLLGSGSPEGVTVANIGRWYVDQDTLDTGIYQKENGSGDTGWKKRS
jgi:hypothetical protein